MIDRIVHKTLDALTAIIMIIPVLTILVLLIVVAILAYRNNWGKVSTYWLNTPTSVAIDSPALAPAPERPVYEPVIAQIQTTSACVELGTGYWHNYIAWLSGASEFERAWLTAVMECESGGNNCKSNYAGSGASGLFQFMPQWYSGSNIFDGHEQVGIALYKYRMGGEGMWKASRHCWAPKLGM